MNKHLRTTLPLVGAAALVSTALMAGTGAALAAKAPPVAEAESPRCQELIGNDVQYRVNYDLSANKGRWLFVFASLGFDDDRPTIPTEYPGGTPIRVNKNANLQAEATVARGPEPATMHLVFTDRKGTVLSTVDTSLCSYGG